MRKHLNWIVAASLGVGSAVFVGCDREDAANTRVSNDTTSTPATPGGAAQDNKVIDNKEEAARTAGITVPGDQIGAADLTKIYGIMGNVAEDALNKGNFDNLVNNLAAPDQERISGQFANQTFADLDGRIDQLQKDFKAKYNADFDLDESAVFENWAKVQKSGETTSGDEKTFVNVMIPAGHGLPALTVPMVKDALAFRINAPDDVSGEQLKKNLQDHLTAAGEMKAQWPADKLDAQRAFVHHVLMAVMNKPVQK